MDMDIPSALCPSRVFTSATLPPAVVTNLLPETKFVDGTPTTFFVIVCPYVCFTSAAVPDGAITTGSNDGIGLPSFLCSATVF